MTERFDTAARYSLLVISLLALVGRYAAGGNEDLDQTGRFTALIVIGGIAIVGWPAVGLMEAYRRIPASWRRRLGPAACSGSPTGAGPSRSTGM